ncbi:hypothetical protein L9F63_002818, partial [Diploptera punctata]
TEQSALLRELILADLDKHFFRFRVSLKSPFISDTQIHIVRNSSATEHFFLQRLCSTQFGRYVRVFIS